MSVATMDAAAAARLSHRHSLHRQRLWALWGSYIALTCVRGDLPGAAVLHADDQPEELGTRSARSRAAPGTRTIRRWRISGT